LTEGAVDHHANDGWRSAACLPNRHQQNKNTPAAQWGFLSAGFYQKMGRENCGPPEDLFYASLPPLNPTILPT
jgi:hypothetical protein